MIRSIAIIFAFILGPIIGYFSGFITVMIDPSTEATIGITRLQGFPIWFYKAAPGISIMSSWHLNRFLCNTAFWTGFFLILATIYFICSHQKAKPAEQDDGANRPQRGCFKGGKIG